MNYEQNDPNQEQNAQPSQPIENNVPIRPRARFIFRAERPIVTYVLLGFTIFIFVLQMISQSFLGADYPFIYGGKINQFIAQGQYWRLITPVFLHGSFIHILFNMYALYIIGKGLEMYYGHLEFALLYFLSGMGGCLFSYLLTPANALGASGAIFGLIAADAILLYKNKEIFGPGAKSMLQRSVMIIVINLIIGMSPGIDNWGHVGGLMVGIVFAWFAGPMVAIERTATEILLRLKSSNSVTLRVSTAVFLVIMAMVFFKSAL
jgi:rhomboid protease GluP